MKRIISNISYIISLSFKYTGLIFAILGFIGLFAPLTDILGTEKSIVRKIIFSCLILIIIWFIVFVFDCLYVYLKRCYKILDVGNGHSVYVQYGDIFAEYEKDNKARNIIIPVNRCFDTIIDDDLISSRTLHGISMNKLYAEQIFTQECLNNEIQHILSERKIGYEVIRIEDKRKGNLKRYKTGTIVEIEVNEYIKYFFLALTKFDKELHANTDDDEYVLALINMLQYNNRRSQGKALYIPLVGAGAADTRKEERDILEYIVKLIKMNKELINCNVHIVIKDSAKERIAITDL